MTRTTAQFGRSRVRWLAANCAVVAIVQIVRAVYNPDFYYPIGPLFAFAFAGIILPTIWFAGYPLVVVVSFVAHRALGGGIPFDRWQSHTDVSLWPLPYAANAGMWIWFLYSFGGFGGWPDDVVFGAAGNLLGLWCYGTVLLGWIRLRKQVHRRGNRRGRISAPDGPAI